MKNTFIKRIYFYICQSSNVADSQTSPSIGNMCLVHLENSELELTILIVFLNATVNISAEKKMLLNDCMMVDDTK